MALSDELRMLARPLPTLERTNRRQDLARLAKFIREHEVSCIVVGHPLRMDGSAGEMADEVSGFAARLEKAAGVPVELLDERLTSWEAARQMPRGDARAAKRRGELDQCSATLILEEYLRREQAAR